MLSINFYLLYQIDIWGGHALVLKAAFVPAFQVALEVVRKVNPWSMNIFIQILNQIEVHSVFHEWAFVFEITLR